MTRVDSIIVRWPSATSTWHHSYWPVLCAVIACDGTQAVVPPPGAPNPSAACQSPVPNNVQTTSSFSSIVAAKASPMAYLAAGTGDTVVAVNLSTGNVARSLSACPSIAAMALSPDDKRLYVACNTQPARAIVIDVDEASSSVGTTISDHSFAGRGAASLAVVDHEVWIGIQRPGPGTIERLDATTWTSRGSFSTPSGGESSIPESILSDASRGSVWLSTWQCRGQCLSEVSLAGMTIRGVDLSTEDVGGIGRAVIAKDAIVLTANGVVDYLYVVDRATSAVRRKCSFKDDSNSLPIVATDGMRVFAAADGGQLIVSDDDFATGRLIPKAWSGRVLAAAYSHSRGSLLMVGSQIGLIEVRNCPGDPTTSLSDALVACEP